MTDATPRPWVFGHVPAMEVNDGVVERAAGPDKHYIKRVAVTANGGRVHTHIALVDGVVSMTDKERRANAALIVRAVNSHDQLVAALTLANDYIQGGTLPDDFNFSAMCLDIDEALEPPTQEGE